MGFDTVPESNQQPPAEQVSVKISHGNEIRRVTLPQASYGSLVENTASLFAVPLTSIVLKYEDDDGDKISLSSDMELREALRISKATQKILRLFVELKAEGPKIEPQLPQQRAPINQSHFQPQVPTYSPQHAVSQVQPTQPAQPAMTPTYMPAMPQYGWGYPHHPHAPHAPPAHPHPFAHAFPSFPFQPSPFPQVPPTPQYVPGMTTTTSGTFSPSAPAAHVTSGLEDKIKREDSHVKHHGPEHRGPYRHGGSVYLGPQSTLGSNYSTHRSSSGTWDNGNQFDRRAHKDSMRMMRDQWKEMKRGATTEEDKRKLRELKEEMRCEMKSIKKDAIRDMKALKLVDKKQRLVARHVEDVTIPDGTELPPNTPFIKTWKIRNEGPVWPANSQLLFISHKGDNLNGPERVVIKGEVSPGQEVEVSVPLITPNEPGRYVGYYRMVTPDNIKFGQRVWVSFIVKRPDDPSTPNM